MRIATAWSTNPDAATAVAEAYGVLEARLGAKPDLIVLHASATLESDAVASTLSACAPGVPLHGGTSCFGAMTQEGFHSLEGTGLGMLGFADPGGRYGVGVASITGQSPAATAALAVRRALERADRRGEMPALILVSARPGDEEELLRGIENVVGPNVPIMGGSSADNAVLGDWRQFADGRAYRDAIVVTAFFPQADVSVAFHNGYEPTENCGVVSRATGRDLLSIDGRPASHVYDEWTGGLVRDVRDAGGSVLMRTTLSPLGRRVGAVEGVPYYILIHPESVTKEGGIRLFANVAEGEEIVLMRGTEESLVSRAGRVARAALETDGTPLENVVGALVVYCAGCMLTVRNRMPDVVASLNEALGGRPFLGGFTFGEHGCFVGGENRHGNLMISVIVFHDAGERNRA